MSDTKILIVDDNPSNLLALEGLLGSEGYALVRAESGGEAIELVREEEFACVLLDVQMPVMDGFETAQRIRQMEKTRRTPIIFLTAKYPSEMDALQGYEAGAIDYLAKPLNMEVVRAKVGVFVELLRTNRQMRRQAEENRRQAEENRRQAEQIAEWERKEAAKIKRLSESRYRNLVEGIHGGIVWIASIDMLKFKFVSQYAKRISGFSLEEWLGQDKFWTANLHPDDRQRVHDAFAGSRLTFEPFTIEHRFIKPDGQVIWFHTSVHIDHSENTETAEFRGLSIDITHMKAIEDALRTAIRSRDEFLSIASHELRTPITPLLLQMQAYVRFIETGRNDLLAMDDLREMLKLAVSQVTRLSRLISQLLEVSRMDIGRFAVDVKEMDIGDIIRNVVRQFYYEIEASGCDVTLNLEPDIFAEIDPLRIEQVVTNLLSNALKYAAHKPIEISLCRSEKDHVMFTIRDHGMGIAAEDQQRIFERYERAISERHYGGLGLGLYISAQIIKHHDGRIWVDSKPNIGSCFYIELPVKQNPTSEYWQKIPDHKKEQTHRTPLI